MKVCATKSGYRIFKIHKPARIGGFKNIERSHRGDTAAFSGESATPFIDQNGGDFQFLCKRDRIGFTWIKSHADTNTHGPTNDNPLGQISKPSSDLLRGAGMSKFGEYGRRNQYLSEKLWEDVECVNETEIADGRRVGYDRDHDSIRLRSAEEPR